MHRVVFVVLSYFFFIATLIGAIIYLSHDSGYFQWGPSNRLFLATVPINTMEKYLSCLLISFILNGYEVLKEGFILPWLYTNLYDKNVKVINDMSRNEVRLLMTLNPINENVIKMIGFASWFSQIDFFVYTLIACVAGSFLTGEKYSKDKIFYAYPEKSWFSSIKEKIKDVMLCCFSSTTTKEDDDRDKLIDELKDESNDSLLNTTIEFEDEIKTNDSNNNKNFDLE